MLHKGLNDFIRQYRNESRALLNIYLAKDHGLLLRSELIDALNELTRNDAHTSLIDSPLSETIN